MTSPPRFDPKPKLVLASADSLYPGDRGYAFDAQVWRGDHAAECDL